MQTSIESCPCGGSPIDAGGETVCSRCGVVLSNLFPDYGPEQRVYTQTERDARTRTGSPLSPVIHDKGLTTVIGKTGRDAMGKRVKPETRIKMLRLKKWNMRTKVHSSEDRNLTQAMSILDRVSEGLNLPFIVKEEAATVYRRALTTGIVRGGSIQAIVAGSLYVAIRQAGLPRTIKEVVAQTTLTRREVSKAYRLILQRLNIKPPRSDGKIYITKIGERLGLSQKIQRDAFNLLTEAKTKRLTAGRDPVGMAASAIYISCLMNGAKITQCQIADASGVTEVTMRNRYKGIINELGIDVSSFMRCPGKKS